ncbi:hypothetical protein ABKV19_004069 [Rosa sericea]
MEKLLNPYDQEQDLHENLFEELSNYRQIRTLKICDNLADRMFREGEHAAAALQNLTGRLHAVIEVDLVVLIPATNFKSCFEQNQFWFFNLLSLLSYFF